jgi:putative DNA primase/helicase
MTRDGEKRIAALISAAEEASDLVTEPTTNGRNVPNSSEDALALAFTKLHGQDLRYVAAWNRWLKWSGTCWIVENTLLPFDYSRRICRSIASLEGPGIARQIASSKTTASIVSLARADRQIAATVEQWDSDPWLLNTPGGIVDLRNGSLAPHRRDAYCTKITAAAPGGSCELWLKFLSQIFGDDAKLISFVQRVVGYSITGITRDHALFFGYGTGANGKGVFNTTIGGVLNEYARTAPMETFTASRGERHPTELAALRGARLVTAVETEEGREWAESRIKLLTGGDRIAARFMRQDFFEYIPQFKLFIFGNHKPRLRTVDEAIRRRLHLIPFSVTIPEKERKPQLTSELKNEWGGILKWAIQGCLEWQRIGLAPPKAVIDATSQYLIAEDAIGSWLETCCERRNNSWTASTELYTSWKNWAEQYGEQAGSQRHFSEKLEARGFIKERRSYGRGFCGLRLATNYA